MKRVLTTAALLVALSALPAPPVLAEQEPGNDDFDNARQVAELPYKQKIDIGKASKADDDPECRGAGHTVWYQFTPSTDMRLTARVRGRRTPAVLSVWTGDRGALTEVFCRGYRPFLELTGGTTYYFMVGTYRNRQGGQVRFRLAEVPPPPTIELTVDPVVTVNNQTEEVTTSGAITCEGGNYTYIYGSVKQRDDVGRQFISAYFYSDYGDFECVGTQETWEYTELGGGIFIDGPALVDVEAYTCNRFECVEAEMIVNVTIDRP
jgi:hypothetical protein